MGSKEIPTPVPNAGPFSPRGKIDLARNLSPYIVLVDVVLSM